MSGVLVPLRHGESTANADDVFGCWCRTGGTQSPPTSSRGAPDLTPQRVRSLHIPTGVPLRYHLDDALTPLVPGGGYLDPVLVATGIAEVAAQRAR